MKQRWFDLGADREDVREAAREVVEILNRRERRALELLRDALEKRASLPWREIEEVLGADARELAAAGRALVDVVAETFVDELGRRGWAFLTPQDVRRITAPQACCTVVKMRPPRVKTLRSTEG